MSDLKETVNESLMDQLENFHEGLVNSSDADVALHYNKLLNETIGNVIKVEDLTIKESKFNDERDIAEKQLVFNKAKLDSDEKLNKAKLEQEKDISEKKLKLENERLEFDKKKALEYDKDIQERKLEIEQKKIENDLDIQEKRLEFEKEKAEFDKKVQEKKLELEEQRLDQEQELNEKRLEIENDRLTLERDAQKTKILLDNEKLELERIESRRRVEENEKNRKNDIKKVVIGACIGVATAGIPIVIKAIADANSDKRKAKLVKEVFNGVVQAESNGNLPFAGSAGSLLKGMINGIIK